MQKNKKFGRKSYIQVLETGLKYIEDRRSGLVRSLKTPWSGFNKAGIGGIEWGSMLTIGARPGAGKTMIMSQILREARQHNPDQDFNVLEFQFEMGDKQYAARQFAGEVALEYNKILSTDKQLDEFTYQQIKKYIEDTKTLEKQGIRRDMISSSLTHSEIREAILETYVEYGNKPLLVTIDHSWLIKPYQKEEKLATLYNTTEMIMGLKNQIPIIVIMATQLNRSIDEASRKTPSSIVNYPTSSDIFGGDALMQGSDMVVAINRPYMADIRSYGPYAYQTKSESLFMHLIKIRNSNNKDNMLFMHMDGAHQRIIEVAPPIADRPTGSFVPRSERMGGGTRTTISADIGSEI